MANYLLRVQLTRESSPHYTLLRDRLLNIGFTKRIRDKTGVEWRLPNGCYYIESTSDLDTVMKAAMQVAHTVDQTPMIVLVEVPKNGITWSGLQRC